MSLMEAPPPLFSIVTVCLDPGEDLANTVESVLSQTGCHFEYIVKDGLSQDGTRSFSCSDPRLTFVSQRDEGVYDAMNQALVMCTGRYVNFLNAGDTFRGPKTLCQVARLLQEHGYPDLVYVDRYNEKLGGVTHYPASLSPWYLFRRPVCHQALFISRSALLCLGGFDTRLSILADYDVLMRLVLEMGVKHAHCPSVAISYQDDGLSSHPCNRARKKDELRRLRRRYYTLVQRAVYGFVWRSTLPGVRIRLVRQSRVPWLRRMLYR